MSREKSNQNLSELQAKIRQQYDCLPYPESDVDYLPHDDLSYLFVHSLVTPYYLRYQQVVSSQDKIILDAGCGSGYNTLVLALANPGAHVIGVDLSEKSIDLARQRSAYHGFENVEFYALPLEEIDSLNYQFDYINCDEVLYLLPDPEQVLKIFNQVLKPQGIIRANLHSYYQRSSYYRSQKVFKLLGLFEEDSVDIALELVQEFLDSLNEHIKLKQIYEYFKSTRKPDPKRLKQWLLTNFLLQGDKGYTIPELFDLLEFAELDFISMVNWRQWEVTDLFKKDGNLPLFLHLGLENASQAEKLELFELSHPIHRLLDFWAVKKNNEPQPILPVNWSEQQWQSCKIYLHPILAKQQVKEDLLEAINKNENFEISQYVPYTTSYPLILDRLLAECLLPLWEGAESFSQISNRWINLKSSSSDTSNSGKNREQMQTQIKNILVQLETYTYILLESV